MSKSKDKGRYYEHRTVDLLAGMGFADAKRVPASGALGKLDAALADDVTFSLGGTQFRVESKMRSHGFAMLRKWIAGTGMLVAWEQRKEPLFVLTRSRLLELLDAQRVETIREVAALRSMPEGKGEIA